MNPYQDFLMHLILHTFHKKTVFSFHLLSSASLYIIDKAPELSGNDNEAEVDHEEGADDDEHDKVDPVPERMSVLCKNAIGSHTDTTPDMDCQKTRRPIVLKKEKPAQST